MVAKCEQALINSTVKPFKFGQNIANFAEQNSSIPTALCSRESEPLGAAEESAENGVRAPGKRLDGAVLGRLPRGRPRRLPSHRLLCASQKSPGRRRHLAHQLLPEVFVRRAESVAPERLQVVHVQEMARLAEHVRC